MSDYSYEPQPVSDYSYEPQPVEPVAVPAFDASASGSIPVIEEENELTYVLLAVCVCVVGS